MVITWRASIKAVATSCTASKSSSAVVCTMAAKWPTGGEDLTKKVGFSVIRQHTTLPGCGGIETVVLKRRFIYLKRQSVVQLLRQIKTRHQLAKTPTGGAFWTGKFTRVSEDTFKLYSDGAFYGLLGPCPLKIKKNILKL